MKNPFQTLFKLTVSLTSLIVAGCASNPVPRVTYLPAAILPPQYREAVWSPDQIAPYRVGRYVDPRDVSIVHEAHTIYRREQTSRPNLTPAMTLIFPPTVAAPVTNLTTMLRDALTAEVNQQRATSQALIEQARNLDQHLRRLNTQTQEFRSALQEAQRVRAEMGEVRNRLETLEGQLRNAPSVSTFPALKNNFVTNSILRP